MSLLDALRYAGYRLRTAVRGRYHLPHRHQAKFSTWPYCITCGKDIR